MSLQQVTFLFVLFISNASVCLAQENPFYDDFEGNGTVTTWFADDCLMDTEFANPFQGAENESATVLRYQDYGGSYANVRFTNAANLNMSLGKIFSIKIYVQSAGQTGNSPNQISLKLQNSDLTEPWTTQTEIIKPVMLDQWQTVTFDFNTDGYVNFNPGSPAPWLRSDLNRVLFQVNGEGNSDQVIAYIDDIDYLDPMPYDPDTSESVFNTLVWSDEFDGTGVLDGDKWFHQTQIPTPDGWFNGEQQHYTDDISNSYQYQDNLHIVAQRQNYTDQGLFRQFTSARLNSKFAFTYGRVEVRAILPEGVGTWPAIWLLGKNINEAGGYWQPQFGDTGWPACGEIDIMEHWGNNQNYVSSALHTPSSFGNTTNVEGLSISDVSTNYHIYGMEWDEDEIRFTVDGNVHYVYHPQVQNSDTWPYFEDQYILLNIAIESGVSNAFQQSEMVIDYVRIYQEGPSTCLADFNGDQTVNVIDFLAMNSAFGSNCVDCLEDLNNDGVVNVNDFILFNSAFGSDCQ